MSPMSEARDPQVQTRRAAWSAGLVLVGVLATIYMISQFFRNSIGVIGPDLAREFDLDARALSVLASIFFLSFALVQIPLGMAIDRYGPRAVILGTAVIVVAGSFYFALARSYGDLVAARLIIGLGCSSFLMAPLAIYASRFRADRFATIVGVHVAGGNIGSLAATAPLAFAAATMGWRGAFLLVGVLACLAAALVFFFVREARGRAAGAPRKAGRAPANSCTASRRRGARPPSRASSCCSLRAIPPSPRSWACGAGRGWRTSTACRVEERGELLLAMVIGQIVGLFVWGSADRLFSQLQAARDRRHAPVRGGAGDPRDRAAAAGHAASLHGVLRLRVRLLAAADRARQVAVSAPADRAGAVADEHRQHRRRVRAADRDRLHHRPLSATRSWRARGSIRRRPTGPCSDFWRRSSRWCCSCTCARPMGTPEKPFRIRAVSQILVRQCAAQWIRACFLCGAHAYYCSATTLLSPCPPWAFPPLTWGRLLRRRPPFFSGVARAASRRRGSAVLA